jgi:hypothetical protein
MEQWHSLSMFWTSFSVFMCTHCVEARMLIICSRKRIRNMDLILGVRILLRVWDQVMGVRCVDGRKTPIKKYGTIILRKAISATWTKKNCCILRQVQYAAPYQKKHTRTVHYDTFFVWFHTPFISCVCACVRACVCARGVVGRWFLRRLCSETRLQWNPKGSKHVSV